MSWQIGKLHLADCFIRYNAKQRYIEFNIRKIFFFYTIRKNIKVLYIQLCTWNHFELTVTKLKNRLRAQKVNNNNINILTNLNIIIKSSSLHQSVFNHLESKFKNLKNLSSSSIAYNLNYHYFNHRLDLNAFLSRKDVSILVRWLLFPVDRRFSQPVIRCVGQEQIACTRSSTREGSGGALSLRDKRKLEGEGAAFIIAFYFHLPIVPWQLSHLYPLFLIRDRSYEFKSKLKSFLPFRAARWKWRFEMEIENIIFLIYRKELYLFIFPCNVSDRCLFGLL